jgi:hypothetical protein
MRIPVFTPSCDLSHIAEFADFFALGPGIENMLFCEQNRRFFRDFSGQAANPFRARTAPPFGFVARNKKLTEKSWLFL